jgi:hypothetical protein
MHSRPCTAPRAWTDSPGWPTRSAIGRDLVKQPTPYGQTEDEQVVLSQVRAEALAARAIGKSGACSWPRIQPIAPVRR